MANAVFNSVESYFAKDKLKPNVPYSKFDLSHIRSMDIDFGILYPFWIEDCLPGDRFKISNVLKLQALPLKNPLFNNIKLYTYYFYVPYYLLWRHFDRFISGGRDGTYTAELPYVELSSGGSVPAHNLQFLNFTPNSLWDYLGFQPFDDDTFVSNTVHSVRVSAFPFAAYQRIFRDYFLNQDVQTSSNVNNWFPADDFDFVLHDGKNYALGEASWASSDRPSDYPYQFVLGDSSLDNVLQSPYLTLLRPKNWNKDYFTSSMFSPQRGPVQALGSNLPSVASLVSDNGLTYSGSNIVRVVPSGSTFKFSFLDVNDISYAKDVLTDQLTKLVSTGNFTISDLHLAQQIELWMERNMQVKAQYNEFLRIHFDDAPLDERLTKPYYIGGSVQDVQISNVMQTSQTTSTSSQGTLTGNASSFDSDYVGTYHSHEYGLIMGICCIMPEAYYVSGVDRHWTKQSRFDFYFPEFCDLEPQAVLRKELYSIFKTSDISTSPLDEPMSYIGRYDEYRHHRSLAVGSLRNKFTADFASWVMPHVVPEYTYGNNAYHFPALNSPFVCTHSLFGFPRSPAYLLDENESSPGTYTRSYLSEIPHDVWASGKTVNPFILQVGISCTAVRPLPYVPDPSRNSY